MLIALALLIISLLLFVRECKLDNKRYQEQERLGDLHMLREFKKFHEEHHLDGSKFDDAINELEKKLK